jgi:O-antigen/teichoic acid export membrane protein
VSGIVLKFVLLTSSIIQLGLLVRNFDEVQAAVFFISLGVYSIFNICEIGAGTSIVSLSQLYPASASKYLVRGLQIYLRFMSIFIAFGFVFFVTPLSDSFNDNWLVGLPDSDWHGRSLLFTLFSLILVRVSTSLVHRFCWANGHGYLSNLALILTSIALTISMYLYATSTYQPNLQTLCLIYYGIPITVDVIIIFKFLKVLNLKVANEENDSDWNFQLRESIRFMGVAAIGVVAFKLDGTTVAFLLTAKHVILITVVWRVYSVVPNLLDFLSKPFWSKFSEAIRLRDRDLARNCLVRYYKIVLSVSLIASMPISIFIDEILFLLDGSSFRSGSVPLLLNISSLLLAIAMAVSGPTSMYLNAAMLGNDLFKVSVILTALNLFLSVLLTYSLGVAGPILGSAISIGVFGIYANHKIAIRHMKQL